MKSWVCPHGTLHSRRDLEMAMQLVTAHPEKFPEGKCIYLVLNESITVS